MKNHYLALNSRAVRLTLPLTVLCFGITGSARAQGLIVEPADIIVIHARVYTENPKQPWAQAVAIHGAKIVAVGDDTTIQKIRGMGTKVINAGGKLVLPGFTDCHIHFMDGSLGLTQVILNGATTVAEIQKRVKEYAAAHPNETWITGMGWTYPTFAPTALPDKKFLDEVVSDRPHRRRHPPDRSYTSNVF